ncbi:MAG: hypothetical protein ACTSVD_05125 [Candidatus Thorarchaeota archaeon]
MIRLIGVMSQGGVPVFIKSIEKTEGEVFLGALIEATKTLSSMIGSGQVMRLDLQDRKLIVTESKKGYTVAAVVDRAEDYVDTLLRIISEEIDKAPIPPADGAVGPLHKDLVEAIVGSSIRYEIDATFSDLLTDVFAPVREVLVEESVYRTLLEQLEQPVDNEAVSHRWNDMVAGIKHSVEEALDYARHGAFDKACAASCRADRPDVTLFAVRTGLMALSMTNAVPPPVELLEEMISRLPEEDPLAALARAAIGRLTDEVSSIDYAHAYEHAKNTFEFSDDDATLLRAFIFVDTHIATYPDFASTLADFFENKRLAILAHFIRAVLDRSALFDKIYSVTSYDEFREELGVWKVKIEEALASVCGALGRVRAGRPPNPNDNRDGIISSFQIQNYITLLTAIAESPVLALPERRNVLGEVQSLYEEYFSALLRSGIPLFIYTVDSVFQSLGVAYAEYYHLTSGDEQEEYLLKIADFLHDIVRLLKREWDKVRHSLAFDVVTNSLSPVLAMAGEMHDAELTLVLAAVATYEPREMDALRLLNPRRFAGGFANITTALASVATRVLDEEAKRTVLPIAVSYLMQAHQFFLTNGIVIRDDIVSLTYLASEAVDMFSPQDVRGVVDTITLLNRVSLQDMKKYDYEVAIMAKPLLKLLTKSRRLFEDESLDQLAVMVYETAIRTWQKYGFSSKADDCRREFSELLP